jgi:imidazoleglycerol-phosphate dehydratase
VTPRTSEVKRVTKETSISILLDLGGSEPVEIDTGLAFFDHLLTSMAFHGRFALTVKAKGDLAVDGHHLVEDTGIVLGQAFAGAQEKAGKVERFGHAVIPMDEALVEAAIDVCGRPTLGYRMRYPQERVGDFDVALIREFMGGLCMQAGISLHVESRCGENSHHVAEALFKALGKALSRAYGPSGSEMSSKGRTGY